MLFKKFHDQKKEHCLGSSDALKRWAAQFKEEYKFSNYKYLIYCGDSSLNGAFNEIAELAVSSKSLLANGVVHPADVFCFELVNALWILNFYCIQKTLVGHTFAIAGV